MRYGNRSGLISVDFPGRICDHWALDWQSPEGYEIYAKIIFFLSRREQLPVSLRSSAERAALPKGN
jgi:hypothetical protein